MATYKDPVRKVGSQSERPSYKLIRPGIMEVDGYQRYYISKDGGVGPITKLNKWFWVKETIRGIDAAVTNDLGCSNGLASFIGDAMSINAYDHDPECVRLVNEVNKFTDGVVMAKQWTWGEPVRNAQLTLCLALIHWVWNCTADWNNFDRIFAYLVSTATDYLIVEWVDPTDRAIKKFGHLGDKAEGYTLEAFEKAAEKIGTIQERYAWCETRTLYLIKINA